MTEPREAPAPSGPLPRYHRALPRLAVLLRGAGLPASPDRWQNVYDLLIALNARGRLPERTADLEPLIAPLLCRSAAEQRQLGELFARWLGDLEPELRGAEEGAESAPVRPVSPVPSTLPRLRWWLLGFVLVLAAVAGGLYWYQVTHQPPPVEDTPPPPLGPQIELSPPVPDKERLRLEPVPPRTPLEQPTLDPSRGAWLETEKNLLLLVPGLFALFWLLLRWLSWKTVLERRQTVRDDPLTGIGLDARADDLLDAPDLRQTLKRLHTPVTVPTRRLDADATVARTARHAGLFQPVRRDRRRVPELVVLVEQRHAGDQMAGLAGQLVDRLRDAGLDLHRYDYRDSPRRLIGRDGRWRPLAEVAGRHEGARLLLIGEPAALLDPFSGEPLPWLDALAPWPARGLLVTRRPPERWQLALAEAGFVVAELDSAGVQTVVLRLGDRPGAPDLARPALTVPLPRLLQDTRRWAQPADPPPGDREALLAVLDGYLGADGIRLITAMAAYPQLHWGLTRRLDLSLFPEPDPDARERRLLKVARLPWSRTGWLPDWLRAALLERLDRRAWRALRRLYRELLDPDAPKSGRTALPVVLPRTLGPWAALRDWLRRRGWRRGRWLAAEGTLSPAHGALNDAIFADVLFGWRVPVLDFVLPRRLLRRHLGGSLRRALVGHALVAALLAAGAVWLAAGEWERWGRAAEAERLLAGQNAAHADYRVTIWQRKETAALARALKATLEADGFAPEVAGTPLALPEGAEGELPAVNKIQWGDVADAPMAEHIKERLRYLAWGADPEVTDKLVVLAALADLAEAPGPGELRVLLLTPGRTGSSFRDPLTSTLTPEQIAELKSPQASPPGGGDADEIGRVEKQIASLERRLAEVERQREQELKGADGQVTGPGNPELKKLSRELASELSALREKLRVLKGGDAGRGPAPAATGSEVFRDPLKGGGEGPEMVSLPGGTFLMGSPAGEPERETDEGPRHEVTVPPFALSRTEVSFADYDRFAEATGRKKPHDQGLGRGERPVIDVSWNDATAYAAWLSGQTGKGYRLPTEAEWEYAARAETQTPFWTGDCIHTDQANYNGKSDYNNCGAKTGVYRQQTMPTGSLPANAYGLHEVAGNVWEWVEDCWHDSYAGAPADGSAWLEANGGDCARRVRRGGGWINAPWYLRSAFRYSLPGGLARDLVGIRLARTP